MNKCHSISAIDHTSVDGAVQIHSGQFRIKFLFTVIPNVLNIIIAQQWSKCPIQPLHMWRDGSQFIMWRDGSQFIMWRDGSQFIMWRDGSQFIMWRDGLQFIMWRDGSQFIMWRDGNEG